MSRLGFGHAGFAGIGNPTVGGSSTDIRQSQTAVGGFHYFYPSARRAFLLDIEASGGTMAEGACAGEGCRANSWLGWIRSHLVRARLIVSGIWPIATYGYCYRLVPYIPWIIRAKVSFPALETRAQA